MTGPTNLGRQTQPMRIIEGDPLDGHADTIPPPRRPAKPEPDSSETKTAVMTAAKPDADGSWDGETIEADGKTPVPAKPDDKDKDAG